MRRVQDKTTAVRGTRLVLTVLALVFGWPPVHADGADIHSYGQQNNLYEWSPGDGTRVRANAQGALLSVGYYEEFEELKERRILLANVSAPETVKELKNVTLVLAVAQAPDGERSYVACRVLEPWGSGASNATDPDRGAPAAEGDATWRFPHYRSDETPDYWTNRAFGGYHATESCARGVLSPDGELVFWDSDFLVRYADWFVDGHGVIIYENATGARGGTLHVHGVSSDAPPHLYLQLEEDAAVPAYMWGVYALIGVAAAFIFVIVAVLLVRRIRRTGYMPLEDFDEYIEKNNIAMTSALVDQREELANSGIKIIKPEDLHYDEEANRIGRGSSGNVYVATLGDRYVAVKRIEKDMENARALEDLISEILYLSALDHRHILPVIGLVVGTGRRHEISMVMPFMREGTLTKHIHSPKHKLDYVTKVKILYQVAVGMEYLHNADPPILHRDLKPPNILLDEELNAHICDFGIARPQVTMMTVMGTPVYMAQECLRGYFTTKSDVYAYGMVFIETINEKRPNPGESMISSYSEEASLEDEAAEGEPLLKDEGAEKAFGALVSSAINEDPAERPSFKKIVDEFEKYIEDLKSEASENSEASWSEASTNRG